MIQNGRSWANSEEWAKEKARKIAEADECWRNKVRRLTTKAMNNGIRITFSTKPTKDEVPAAKYLRSLVAE
jgi:hypothetical protein